MSGRELVWIGVDVMLCWVPGSGYEGERMSVGGEGENCLVRVGVWVRMGVLGFLDMCVLVLCRFRERFSCSS